MMNDNATKKIALYLREEFLEIFAKVKAAAVYEGKEYDDFVIASQAFRHLCECLFYLGSFVVEDDDEHEALLKTGIAKLSSNMAQEMEDRAADDEFDQKDDGEFDEHDPWNVLAVHRFDINLFTLTMLHTRLVTDGIYGKEPDVHYSFDTYTSLEEFLKSGFILINYYE